MSDDRKDQQSAEGFDDWLGDEPGPVTDPYKVLASEDAEEEIADWMEFSQGTGTHEVPSPEESEEDVTAEIEAVATGDDAGIESGDETSEIDAVAPDEGSTATEEASDENQDDTGELDVVSVDEPEPAAEESEAKVPEISDSAEPMGADGWELTSDDDTDELEPVASIAFGELWADDAKEEAGSTTTGAEPESFDISEEDYLHTATREHAVLAESIALADDESTERVALAAPIPGLDSTVVGFEDVVEAEGHGRVRARASGDLIARVITGIVLVAALGASLLWRPALVALVLGIFVLSAGEFYTALVRSGRKPIALFGFLGIIGACLGAFFFGALWIPVAFILVTTVLLLFYAVVPGRDDPMGNLALTITVMVWAGLGSFALLIANADGYRTLVFGLVAAVAAMDIAQYFFGRALGRHQLAPWVSPNKTVEGLVAGVVVALTVGALLHFLQPFELTSGLAIGAAVAVFAPMGDLAMSAAKRSLGLKDMGSVLPGHGGFLDRIDGFLFVIPVAWAIFLWAGIL
ncbi:MAG: hypothetical protein DRJ28_01000 [Actinobacteria bacterium]|nr:MAG: hypothetical protein DRJ28_01000 [Actinomycetota bacterium]